VTVAATVRGSESRTFENVTANWLVLQLVEIHNWEGPYRYGNKPDPIGGPAYPNYDPAWYKRENPYDPGYAPFPYTPQGVPVH
jgi:starvation-inducible outer membrane lipoprotein